MLIKKQAYPNCRRTLSPHLNQEGGGDISDKMSGLPVLKCLKCGVVLIEGVLMYCPNCGKEINSDYNFCMHCGYELRNFNNKQKDLSLDLEIEYSKLNDHIKKEVDTIVDKLLVSNLGDFVKQWINFSVLVIFHNFKVVCELKDNVKDYIEYIELARVPTPRSLNMYLKIFLIHFLIVFPNNENNKKILMINKLSFDEFKHSVFNCFDFDGELKKIYEKGSDYYQKNEIKYSDYMLKNYIMHSFNEKIEEVNFITSSMFRISLSNAYAGLIDYFNAV